MTTWRREIQNEMDELFETWDDVEGCTLTDEQLDLEFRDDYMSGVIASGSFNLWTSDRVYFPVRTRHWYVVESVMRNPGDGPTAIIGG